MLSARLILTPIPLSNILPALIIALISLAYTEEDGLVLSISLLVGFGSNRLVARQIRFARGNVAMSVDRECPLIEVFGRTAHQRPRPDRGLDSGEPVPSRMLPRADLPSTLRSDAM